MRRRLATTSHGLLTGTAGVLAYGLLCAGPPDTMMGTPPRLRTDFRQGWWGGGRHVFRCVLSRARAHLAHSGRAPNVARLARLRACGTLGASGARSASGAPEVPGTLGPQGCLAHLARLAHVAHLAPASRTWGRCWFPVAAHPKTAAEHAEARVLLMCWEGGWE